MVHRVLKVFFFFLIWVLTGCHHTYPIQNQLPVVQVTQAKEFSGNVVGVIDGDTIDVMHEGKAERVRLYGIDAPEKRQAFGAKAKQFVSGLVFNTTVKVIIHGKDRYNRTIGEIALSDGRILNHEIVRAGFAWWYEKYAPKDEQLKQLQKQAQELHKGLWIDQHPVEPWNFRKGGNL